MKPKALRLWAAFGISIAPALPAVPLTITQRHILVNDVYLDGAGPFRFVLDTGAQSSSVRTSLAEKIGLKPAYRVENESVGGVRYVPVGLIDSVTLGGRTATHIEMLIHPLEAVREVDPHVEGVLGQNFLARFNYLLDIRGRRLSFPDPLAGTSSPGEAIPFTRVADRMVVRAADMHLVLDSGAGLLVLFHDRKDLHDTGLTGRAAAVTGAANIRIAQLSRLQIGERTLKNLPAAVIPQAQPAADGLLPLTLFDAVYVNNAASYVILR